MKKIFTLLLYAFISGQLFAGDFRNGNTVTINKPAYQDLYIAAGTVIINAPVYGDLIIAGGTITINDTVMNDILITGGTININGYAGDDVRCAGGNISIGGKIVGDLIVAGGTVIVEKTATVSSISVAGGEVTIDGSVANNIISRAGKLKLTGNVGGNADLRGSEVQVNGTISGKSVLAATSKIVIGRQASFGRSIRYWHPYGETLKVSPSASRETPVYDPLLSITRNRWYFLGAATFLGLLWYLGMAFLMIVIIQYIFPSLLSKAGREIHARPLRSTALGFAFFIAVPVAIIVSLVTVIGVPVAVILAVAYLLLILLATVISALVIVNWANYISDKSWGFWRIAGTALFAFMLLKIISFTPFLGWLLIIIIVATSFGAIVSNVKFRTHARQNS